VSHHLDDRRQVEPDFAKAIGGLAEAYGTALTAMRIQLYAAALGDLDLQTVRQCCSRALKACKFFPSAAELRSFAQATDDDRASLAWAGFAQAAGDIGAWSSLEVVDGAAAAALVATFGSWPEYCALADIAVATKRHEFLAAYRQALRDGHYVSTRLAGALEAGGQVARDSRVWVGVLTANGGVTTWREPKELAGGDGHARPAIGQAGDAEAGEGAALARRGEGQARRPGKVRGA
jgi:hypothetical protein